MSIVDLSGKRRKSARATASPTTPRVPGKEEISAYAVVGYIENNRLGIRTSADDDVIHYGLG